MAEDTRKKIPGGPSRLSGRGAAFKAARERYKKSGGTDPYAKDAQFTYNGKAYNVAMAGEKRGSATGTKRATSPGPEQPLAKVSSPEYRAGASTKTRPADMTPDKKPVNRMSAQQYMDKAKEDFKNDPLKKDMEDTNRDAATDAAIKAGTYVSYLYPGVGAARGAVMLGRAGARKGAELLAKRAAAKEASKITLGQMGKGRIVSAEESIARAAAKPKKFRDPLPKQAETAEKVYASDKAQDMVDDTQFSGMKKGGTVKAKKNALPDFLLNRFKKKGDDKMPMKMDKTKMPKKMSMGGMATKKMAKGGMVSRGNGCAQRGFK